MLVIGCPGAGKSTFSRVLSERTGLPLVHLDQLYWKAGWMEASPGEFRSNLDEVMARDAWIMDGNFRGTFGDRLRHADTAVFLDIDRRRCLWNVLRRTAATYGQVRPDMSDGCPERFDWEFIKFIWSFPKLYRPELMGHLSSYEGKIVQLERMRMFAPFLNAVPISATVLPGDGA